MTGKIVLAVLLSFAMLTTAGCAFIKDPGETEESLSSPGETDEDLNRPVEPDGGLSDGSSQDPGSGAGSKREDMPDNIILGDPLSYFGKKMAEVKKEFGEPNDQGFFEGSEYFSYPDRGIVLFFWAKPDEATLVRSINLARGIEVAGIKVGMTFGEIKAVLGAPVFEGYSDYLGYYSLVCDYGQYRFFFAADTIDGTTGSVQVKYRADAVGSEN